jgi:hypothetical protein
VDTRSLVVMAWVANLDTAATNRAVDHSQPTSLRLLHHFHSMILEDLVVAIAASLLVLLHQQTSLFPSVKSTTLGALVTNFNPRSFLSIGHLVHNPLNRQCM